MLLPAMHTLKTRLWGELKSLVGTQPHTHTMRQDPEGHENSSSKPHQSLLLVILGDYLYTPQLCMKSAQVETDKQVRHDKLSPSPKKCVGQ